MFRHPDEMLSRVFDIILKRIMKYRENEEIKSTKSMLITTEFPKPHHTYDLFKLDELLMSVRIACSLLKQLVENVVLLLEVLNVWDENQENVEWEEMAQVGVRILLAFISRPETEYCATASSKLSKLLKARKISSQGELCYILGCLHHAFVASREKGKIFCNLVPRVSSLGTMLKFSS